MAVVQISRIQVRRGKASSGTGFPQLASGEMGWAIDTQELYIGNGSVAEGAPAVGNTKLLTENNLTAQGNILTLIQHQYKKTNQNIQTGEFANFPVVRSLQDRLDDRVSLLNFIRPEDVEANDYTKPLQRAIDQLFLNPAFKASLDADTSVAARIVLEIPAGNYRVTGTVYIPSYATILGHGSNKTVINFESEAGTGTAFRFVNDLSTIGNPVAMGGSGDLVHTEYNTQPRFIEMRNLTVTTSTIDELAFQLDAVRDSVFEYIVVKGVYEGVASATGFGFKMNAVSSVITCERNLFRKVSVIGFTSAVYAKQDINNNTFKDCFINNARQGFVLGDTANGTSIGEQYGPRNTEISDCVFDFIAQQAVYAGKGTANTVRNSSLINVGNVNGSVANPGYPQVYFTEDGNSVVSVKSDRTAEVGNGNSGARYIPEVGGEVTYSSYGNNMMQLGQNSGQLIFRLPLPTAENGLHTTSVNYIASYIINYTYASHNASNPFTRRGTITITAGVRKGSNGVYAVTSQLADDYEFAGTDTPDGPSASTSTKIDFSVLVRNQSGAAFSPVAGQIPSALAINYANTITSDSGRFSYSYTTTVSKSFSD